MTIATTRLAPLALAASAATATFAGVHTSDIILTVDDNAITTNTQGDMGPEATSVFLAELDFIAGFWSTANPGYDCLPGTFTPGNAIGFVIEDAVREWDGADFDGIADEQISIEFGPAGPIFSPLTPDTDVVGFTIPIQSNGGWHKHYDYYLEAPADEGVYLLRMRLTYTGGLDDSEPFYLIFNQSQDPMVVSDAFEYVETVLLAPPCPEDINSDTMIDTADLGILIAAFGSKDSDADINGDGIVDTADLGILIAAFGQTCD